MAVYDTEENGRTEYTKKTLDSIWVNIEFDKHRLVIIDNNSCYETKRIFTYFKTLGLKFDLITLSENVGTARAINMAIKLRQPNEPVVKIDNDVVINSRDWVEEMEEVLRREPKIGIVGLKRKDLCQTPWHENEDFRSYPTLLPHEPGQTWIMVEKTKDIMGTCTMLSPQLLDALGGYVQYGVYGFDDTILNLRAGLAGFEKCFLSHIEIDHLDTGDNPYSEIKRQQAAEAWPEYHKLHLAYCSGTRPLFEEI